MKQVLIKALQQALIWSVHQEKRNPDGKVKSCLAIMCVSITHKSPSQPPQMEHSLQSSVTHMQSILSIPVQSHHMRLKTSTHTHRAAASCALMLPYKRTPLQHITANMWGAAEVRLSKICSEASSIWNTVISFPLACCNSMFPICFVQSEESVAHLQPSSLKGRISLTAGQRRSALCSRRVRRACRPL